VGQIFYFFGRRKLEFFWRGQAVKRHEMFMRIYFCSTTDDNRRRAAKKVHEFARMFDQEAKIHCEQKTREHLASLNITVPTNRSLQHAALTFLLNQKSIDCILVGMRHPEYVESCLGVLKNWGKQ
jgi:aryl-alcohol dehydrogenase-like predicted oxidoreductase